MVKNNMLENMIYPLCRTEWGKRAGLGAMAILSILLLTAAVRLPITWIQDIKLGRLPTEAAQNNLLLDTQTANLIQHIPDWHLFGATPARSSEGIPVTSLPLRLTGIINAAVETESRAIISQSGQEGKVYQAGEDVLGAHITAIEQDTVLLDNGGQLEKLPLGRPPLLFQGMPKELLPEE